MRVPVFILIALATFALSVAVAAQRRDAFPESRDHPAIAYSTAPVRDAVSALNRRLQEGQLRLAFDPTSGYLRSVLDALSVPVESQTLAFSQASLQGPRINMQNPRALYFNDSVSVGWVRGGEVLEVAAQDPRQGVIFYELDQQPAAVPQFRRNDQCLTCHLSWDTLAVPGLLVMSMYPLPDDKYAYANGFVNDHRSPFRERWGGWYVTGAHGATVHMGNIAVMPVDKGRSLPNPIRPRASLEGVFDLKGFPTPYSDVVALMVLAHQTHMTNLLTRLGWEARLQAQNARPDSPERVASAVADLVDYMLFVDEIPLTAPIEGTAGLAERFATAGLRDGKGRSLRDLDLQRRLLRYPCSYLIYTEAFDALPAAAKEAVYARMWQVLSGQERAQRYARLTLGDRRAIVEILRETKKDLPAYFQPVTR
ncbi:MAG: hypothetical protein HY657_17265 [Acidobacteria bacterium]|nr:hypothetical protein [Acidobacteriota bacterium]